MTPKHAVLLMAYGGPASLDEVEPFLKDVRGGRETPEALVEEVKARYREIGGASPILERSREQAEALEERLNREEPGEEARQEDAAEWRVFVGMRHWKPYVREAVEEIVAGGFGTLVALCLTPQESRMSVGAYFRALDEALGEVGLNVVRVRSWHDHPGFVGAVAEKVLESLERFPEEERGDVQVVFTAHSLPERILREGDPYDRQVRETAAAVARAVEERAGRPLGRSDAPSGERGGWHVAYQSAGARAEPWLGPSLPEVMNRLAREGHRSLLAAPVGFVSDHVEVLFDLDVEAVARARGLRVRFERTESLNASPAFIDALADVVRSAVSGKKAR